jgi:hypothetical protein
MATIRRAGYLCGMWRSRFALLTVFASALLALVVVSALPAASNPAPGASCLRGRWVASQAEANRVLQALAPGPFRIRGQLNASFLRGLFVYGSSAMVLETTTPGLDLKAHGSFLYQAAYTVRNGNIVTQQGTSALSFDEFTATKNGRTASVPGPPDSSRTIPGGPTPFQCTRTRLKIKLPSFASSGWVVYQRSSG